MVDIHQLSSDAKLLLNGVSEAGLCGKTCVKPGALVALDITRTYQVVTRW